MGTAHTTRSELSEGGQEPTTRGANASSVVTGNCGFTSLWCQSSRLSYGLQFCILSVFFSFSFSKHVCSTVEMSSGFIPCFVQELPDQCFDFFRQHGFNLEAIVFQTSSVPIASTCSPSGFGSATSFVGCRRRSSPSSCVRFFQRAKHRIVCDVRAPGLARRFPGENGKLSHRKESERRRNHWQGEPQQSSRTTHLLVKPLLPAAPKTLPSQPLPCPERAADHGAPAPSTLEVRRFSSSSRVPSLGTERLADLPCPCP